MIRTAEQAREWRRKLTNCVNSLEDASAIENTDLFPAWIIGKRYVAGDRIKYNDKLYRCVQSHTSQEDWTPDRTPALWVVVSVEEWPNWVQPTGAHDAYELGDRVSHNDKHWESSISANVYEPGVYGWDEVTE